MDHGTVSGVRGLRLEMEASAGLRRVLVAHGAVFVDEDNGLRLAREVDCVVSGLVAGGNTDKVLTRKVAVGRCNDVVVDVILAQLRGGASRVVVRLDAWVDGS